MGLKGFIFRKVVAACLTICVIVCVNFVIFRMAPGDPVRMMFRDPRVSAEKLEEMKQVFGLDKPLSGQFVAYVKNLSRGELGMSFSHRRPVLEVITQKIPATLLLVITALMIAIILGVALGALSGWFSDSSLDRLLMGITQVIAAFPALLLAMVLIYAFGIRQGLWVFALALCLIGWGEGAQFVRGHPGLDTGPAAAAIRGGQRHHVPLPRAVSEAGNAGRELQQLGRDAGRWEV